jgi:5-methylcytosine-specific restriction enzyme subunit McrC
MEFKDSDKVIQLKGFFFDMNRFFESIVEKLIQDFVPDYTLREQFQLNEMFSFEAGFNPRRRRTPTPRPDFALMKGNKVVKLMDAKYKDLWQASLPRDMLYQLGIYALSSEGDKTATIIYPSDNVLATTQKIAINDPTNNYNMGTVLLKSLNLNKVAVLLQDVTKNRRELVRYMDKVLFVD